MITLLLILGPVLGFAVVASSDSRWQLAAAEEDGLDRTEKKELQSYRKTEMEVIEAASQAATLGDDSGVQILAILSKNRAERNNIK